MKGKSEFLASCAATAVFPALGGPSTNTETSPKSTKGADQVLTIEEFKNVTLILTKAASCLLCQNQTVIKYVFDRISPRDDSTRNVQI